MGNGTESTYAYDRQRERLQGMLHMANRYNVMETQEYKILTAGFQLVENTLNNFNQTTFWGIAMFRHRQMGQNFRLFVSLSSTSYMRGGFVLALLHKDNKLPSIYRNIKSQENFYI